MVLTEPDAGSDVGAGTTRAVHVEGDLWHLEGVKRFITGGEHDGAENIIHLVLARPVGAGPGTKGLSLFMVPKWLVESDGTLGERNGIYATRVEHKMGLKGSTTCELTLGADRPCVGFLVGGVHDGIRQMFRVVEHARMMIGTKSAATMSTGYLNALAYATERVQGADLTEASDKSAPRVPIIRHPDVRRMLMEQKATAEGLRALVSYAAAAQGLAETAPDNLSLAARCDLLLPLVKGYASEKAYEVLARSLQVLGGSGYTEDYPLEQYIRDSKVDTVYEGTTGIQALDLFFRKIARDQGRAVQELLTEMRAFAKGGPDDELTPDRDLLGGMLDDLEVTARSDGGPSHGLARRRRRPHLLGGAPHQRPVGIHVRGSDLLAAPSARRGLPWRRYPLPPPTHRSTEGKLAAAKVVRPPQRPPGHRSPSRRRSRGRIAHAVGGRSGAGFWDVPTWRSCSNQSGNAHRSMEIDFLATRRCLA